MQALPCRRRRRQCLPLRDRIDPLHHGLFQQEHRGGVLGTVGSQLVQPPDSFHGDAVEMDGQVAFQRRSHAAPGTPGQPTRSGGGAGSGRFSSRTERPAAMAWPPKRRRRSSQEAMQACRLKPCTLRPLPLPSPCSSMDTTMTGRPVLFHQPGCHDANDAGVPVPAPDQDDPVLQTGPARPPAGPARPWRSRTSVSCRGGVDLVQFMGQLGSAFLILTQHQLQGGHGAVHPARRVDAGGNGVADILGGHGLARTAPPHPAGPEGRAGQSAAAGADPL